MNEIALHAEIAAAQAARTPCALATLVSATGSVPRAPGARMLVYVDGRVSGTIGGGKFEALVIAEALEILRSGGAPRLKTYTLREGEPTSFGAICGGEAGVFLEALTAGESLTLIGGGHCARAIARLAADCGFYVTVIDDPPEGGAIGERPAVDRWLTDVRAPEFIATSAWTERDALVIVTRNAQLDQAALDAALRRGVPGYIGMMGSRRKVARVFAELAEAGHAAADLARVHAPIGLDIGADSPAEIAVSVVAEILQHTRGRPRAGGMKAGGSHTPVRSAEC
jgi:xanthine dehydrogenase accessory factor